MKKGRSIGSGLGNQEQQTLVFSWLLTLPLLTFPLLVRLTTARLTLLALTARAAPAALTHTAALLALTPRHVLAFTGLSAFTLFTISIHDYLLRND
jgi:hypothetical protein